MLFDTMPLGERWGMVSSETVQVLNIKPGIIFHEQDEIRCLSRIFGR